MTDLDGKEIWIPKFSDIPDLLGLDRVVNEEFTHMRRCDGANADVKDLSETYRPFISISMKMVVSLNHFGDPNRNQPGLFIQPKGELAELGALIHRAPSEVLSGTHVYEALLLPCTWGMVVGGFWRRKLGTYDVDLIGLHSHRIMCWYNNFDAAPPSNTRGRRSWL